VGENQAGGLDELMPGRQCRDRNPGVAVFPAQLRVGDRFTDAAGDEWEIASRPVTYKQCESREPELAMFHAWLDTWGGLGAVVVAMRRHGYDLSLTSDENGCRATFLHRSYLMRPWVGQVLWWWPTPWRAVQEARVARG